METLLLITISGPDRSGLVERLAEKVAANGGNWEHSRMTHLGDRFVGLLQVRVPHDRKSDLELAVRGISELDVIIASADAIKELPTQAQFELEITGSDHPGIVRDIFSALNIAGANVEHLQTETVSAPESGGLLFQAKARLSCSEGVDHELLRAQLESIAHDILVDIDLKN
jgi:glycine cleavage system regulatory protein